MVGGQTGTTCHPLRQRRITLYQCVAFLPKACDMPVTELNPLSDDKGPLVTFRPTCTEINLVVVVGGGGLHKWMHACAFTGPHSQHPGCSPAPQGHK